MARLACWVSTPEIKNCAFPWMLEVGRASIWQSRNWLRGGGRIAFDASEKNRVDIFGDCKFNNTFIITRLLSARMFPRNFFSPLFFITSFHPFNPTAYSWGPRAPGPRLHV